MGTGAATPKSPPRHYRQTPTHHLVFPDSDRGPTPLFVLPDPDPVPTVGRGYHPNGQTQQTPSHINTLCTGVSRGRPMGTGAATPKPPPRHYRQPPPHHLVFPDSDRGHTLLFVLPDPDPVPTVDGQRGAATTQTDKPNNHPRTSTPCVRASLVGARWGRARLHPYHLHATTGSRPHTTSSSPTPIGDPPRYSSCRTPIRYPRPTGNGARLTPPAPYPFTPPTPAPAPNPRLSPQAAPGRHAGLLRSPRRSHRAAAGLPSLPCSRRAARRCPGSPCPASSDRRS